jgi:H+/gluconate symporter-like permease
MYFIDYIVKHPQLLFIMAISCTIVFFRDPDQYVVGPTSRFKRVMLMFLSVGSLGVFDSTIIHYGYKEAISTIFEYVRVSVFLSWSLALGAAIVLIHPYYKSFVLKKGP